MPSLVGRIRSTAMLWRSGRGGETGDTLSPDEDYNSKLLAAEAPLGILATGGVSNFFALFAIQLGASNSLVGWLTSGPALLNLFWVIPAGRLVQRASTFARPMAVGALLHRLMLVSLALVPFLPADWRPWGLVVLVTLAAAPDALRWLAMQAACGEMYQPRHMARAMGRRWATMSLCAVVLTPLLGQFVDLLPFPRNFQWLFAGAGVITLGTIWLVLKLRLPPREPELRQSTSSGAGQAIPWRRLLRRHRAFILYEVGILTLQLATFGAAPLYRIYWVRDLGATGIWVGLISATGAIGGTIGNILWGRWSHPERDRRNVLITCIGTVALYPLLAATFSILPAQIGVGLLAGFFSGGNGLMLFNRTVQVSPRRQRPTFLAIHSITNNVAGFVAPLITAGLADMLGTRPTLLVVSAIGLLASVLIYVLGWDAASDEDASLSHGSQEGEEA